MRDRSDHETVIAEGAAAHVVTAASDCRQQVALARTLNRGDDIRHSRAPGDERWMLVDARIPDPAGIAVAAVAGIEKLAVEG